MPFHKRKLKHFSEFESHALLALLLIQVLAAPFVLKDGAGVWLGLLHATYQAILFIFLVGVGGSRRQLTLCVGFIAVGEVVSILGLPSDRWGALISDLLAGAATSVVLVVATRRFLASETVTRAMMSAAIALYLMSGVLWALLFNVIEGVYPGSFTTSEGQVDAADLLYFSYVTMTTLGYGDIAPASEWARSAALLQALYGQFFVAVVIGRLVAVYVAGQGRRDEAK
ncbi:MAG: potassium channel family protein [Planctomycetota bacterium]